MFKKITDKISIYLVASIETKQYVKYFKNDHRYKVLKYMNLYTNLICPICRVKMIKKTMDRINHPENYQNFIFNKESHNLFDENNPDL
jgi:hypothetical protein